MQRDTCDIFLGLYSVTERRQRGDHGITVCARTTAPRRSVRRAAYEHSPCGRATPGGNYLLRPTADGERPALHYVNDEVRAIARREAAGKPTLTAKARVLCLRSTSTPGVRTFALWAYRPTSDKERYVNFLGSDSAPGVTPF